MFSHKIRWPIYAIGNYRSLKEIDNVLRIITDYGAEYVVDNKNLYGDTLGNRRLRVKDEKLYKLKGIYYTAFDVFNSKYKTFIDSNGILFTLNKKVKRDLIYAKVIATRVHKNKVLCTCEGIGKLIEIPFIPKIMPKYLGLLKIPGDFLLYELSKVKKKDTWRKF